MCLLTGSVNSTASCKATDSSGAHWSSSGAPVSNNPDLSSVSDQLVTKLVADFAAPLEELLLVRKHACVGEVKTPRLKAHTLLGSVGAGEAPPLGRRQEKRPEREACAESDSKKCKSGPRCNTLARPRCDGEGRWLRGQVEALGRLSRAARLEGLLHGSEVVAHTIIVVHLALLVV